LEVAASRFRRELLNNERQAASAMVRAYGAAWGGVRGRVEDLQGQIDAARARGEDVSAAWLFQLNRAQTLQAQVEAELRTFVELADGSTTALQREAVAAAGRHAAGLVDLAAGVRPVGLEVPFDVLPAAALEDLIGFAGDGSPLRVVFGEIAGGAAERVTDVLASSVAAGLGPRETARIIRRTFGTGLARALTVSRTETLRAYRAATQRNFAANSDVVEGWVWLATLSTRTCPACWAMHGTVHGLDEAMDSHPNCRCTAMPAVKSWAALGLDLPDARPVVEPGEDVFARLPAVDQRKVLGPAAFEAYRAGAVRLEQFAAHGHSDEWGDTLQVASLRRLLGDEAARRFMQMVRAARAA
jgi:SPP1 gp7 family putative phage head morphogenesis protein